MVPAGESLQVARDEASMREWADELVARARDEESTSLARGVF